MRKLSFIAFVAFPLGAMAVLSGAALESSGYEVAGLPGGILGETLAAIMKNPLPTHEGGGRLAVGEVLQEGTTFYSVPQHQSYRYAVVQGQRAIVDAASRQIVYIIR